MERRKSKAEKIVPVKITLSKGLVQCAPCRTYVRRGESIEWDCAKNFPFAIHLGYDSPFAKVHHQALRQQRIRLNIAKNTPCGSYKYIIAVFNGSKVWIEDPELIIRP